MPKETDRLKLPLPLGNENVTRESINGIFEKIDAGVATRESILIPAESDLNSYITEGEYYCPTNATVGTLANSPVGVAFHLTIERHAGVVQTLTTFEPSNLQVFQRNYYVGWGPWKKVPTTDDIEEVKEYTDQKLGEIVINDASLTDKGIVQLSNAVDGTREDLAATEKAVRDARVAVASDLTKEADLRSSDITITVGKGTPNAQFSTIQSAVNSLKKFNAGRRTIKVERGTSDDTGVFTESVSLKDFHGGPIHIAFDPKIKLKGGFSFDDCSCEILINGNWSTPLEIESDYYSITAQSCRNLSLLHVHKITKGLGYLWASKVQSLYLFNCKFSNQQIPFTLHQGSFATFESVSGTNNAFGGDISASILILDNYTASSAPFSIIKGGQVFK
ncbi:tail fiber protein [Paenibacillus sp. FSL M8-0212]|uniref:tail fiber protein n=1 Tax=Paenibacillus sp. FSL M8-0212 TaxID=2921618 RepID=UPI0030F834CF